MSKIYDNWERLVAAVIKREEIWELCHAPSRSSSSSSVLSDFESSSSSRYDENSKSAKSEVQEYANYQSDWIEEYEAGIGVYITTAVSIDGKHEIKRVRFRQRQFTEEEAKTWWLNNKEKVYKKYSIYSEGVISTEKNGLPENDFDKNVKSKHSEVGESGAYIVDQWLEQYEPSVYVALGAFGDGFRVVVRVHFSRTTFTEKEAVTWWLNNKEKVYKKYSICSEEFVTRKKNALPKNDFEKNVKSKHSVVWENGDHIVDQWLEQYEPGVYVTLVAFSDGSRIVVRVHFSREIFTVAQAEAWCLQNREKVYEKYNVSAGLAQIGHSSGEEKKRKTLKVSKSLD